MRGLVFTVLSLCAAGVLVYQRWTNPAAVKEQVLAKLRQLFPGGVATVDSARLRLLGGIMVNELRLARRDDVGRAELLHVPSAVIFHDKEKLLDGELSLRKVELHRARLKVLREPDGKWNLDGLTGPLQPHLVLPTLVLHQGTLTLEDRRSDGSPRFFELTNVSLTLINDPVSVVSIEGSAVVENIGKVQVRGQWQRGTRALTLSLRGERLKLSNILAEKLGSLCPSGTLDGLKLEGLANFQADLCLNPGNPEPFTYDVRLELKDGTCQHPRLPLPLEGISGLVECGHGEVRVKKFQARSGKAEIKGTGAARLPCVDQAFEAHLEVRHLELESELFKRLPEKLRKLDATFQPVGPVTLKLDCARGDGQWQTLKSGAPSRVVLQPEALSVCFVKFPYPLQRLTGTLDMNLLTGLIEVDVTGYTGPKPVFVKGTWQGEGTNVAAKFDIVANDIPLDESLLTALQPQFQALARSFHPKGLGDFKAHLHQEPGGECRGEYHIHVHDTSACWDRFPYPLENVSGYLDVYPKYWEFRDFRGVHNGGEVFVQGHSASKKGEGLSGLVVELKGSNVLLDDTLYQAFKEMPQLARTWETFQPQGRANFTAKLEQRAANDTEMTLSLRGGRVTPTFFPYPLDEVTGTFHYARQRVVASHISARNGNARVALDRATVELHQGGGHYTEVPNLRVEKLVLNEELLHAMPRAMREAARAFHLRTPIDLQTRLIVAQSSIPGSSPDVFWDGQINLRKATLNTGVEWKDVDGTVAAVGRHNGRHLLGLNGNAVFERATLFQQPFHDVQVKFQVKEQTPDIMLVGFKAPLFGGDVSGEGRIEFASALRYELNLTATQIDVAEFGKHNLGPGTQLEGIAVARLHLTGQGSDLQTLDGNGTLDVPSGKLYNLPLLLDLLKFLGLRWPDRTAFEELHAVYGIRGRRLYMRRLELWGNAISLTGQGEVNLDGTDLAVEFYPSWARVEQLLPPAVRGVPPALTKNLITIEMRGKISGDERDRKFTKKALPILTDPLLHWRDRLAGAPALQRRDLPVLPTVQPRMKQGN